MVGETLTLIMALDGIHRFTVAVSDGTMPIMEVVLDGVILLDLDMADLDLVLVDLDGIILTTDIIIFMEVNSIIETITTRVEDLLVTIPIIIETIILEAQIHLEIERILAGVPIALTLEAEHLILEPELLARFLEEEIPQTEIQTLLVKIEVVIQDNKDLILPLATRLLPDLTHHHQIQVDRQEETMVEEDHQEDQVAEGPLEEEEDDKYVSL